MLNEIFNKYPKAETRFLANIAAVKSVTLQDIWKLFVDLTLHCDKYRKRSNKKKAKQKKMKEHIVTILNKTKQNKSISSEPKFKSTEKKKRQKKGSCEMNSPVFHASNFGNSSLSIRSI